jgi:hypothetical protein
MSILLPSNEAISSRTALENYKGRRPGCAVCPYALDAVLFFGCSVGVNQTMTEERGAAAISIATKALIGRT